jgi:outer membrane lipoprotein-sorting protein
MKNALPQIVLWIDLEQGISVRQQFFQQQGDYRIAKYSAIRVNEKIPNDVFQLKTTSKTQFVSSGG